MADVQSRMARIEQKVEHIDNNVTELKEEFHKYTSKSDRLYAGKWVENLIKYGLYTAAAVLVTALTVGALSGGLKSFLI